VYCLAHEMEVGPLARYGGFEIEHFQPRGKFGQLRHQYRNLLWACAECNRAKGGHWPTANELAFGARFVDPSAEGLGKHLELSGKDDVVSHSPAGAYMIRHLNLRSPLHRERRRDRNDRAVRYELLKTLHELQAREVADLVAAGRDAAPQQEKLKSLGQRLDDLRPRIYSSKPFDAPKTCCRCIPPRGETPRY
jgi:hypothetical protein